MKDFDFVFDRMTHSFDKLEHTLEYLYDQIKNNPNDEYSKELLLELGNVGLNMLDSQMCFTDSYADKNTKEFLMTKLHNKKTALSNALDNTKGRSK